MKKVRAHYKGKYYYLGRAKNLEEELNDKQLICLKKIQNHFVKGL